MEEKIFCQSCGMPMTEEKMFGTEADGSKNQDYCIYCYENGAFTAPNITMDEMIELCIPHVVEAGVCPDDASARKMMQGFFPTLKRWREA